MRIAVISPHTQHNGTTTLSMLISLELAKSKRKVCLAHSKPISNSVSNYLSFSSFEDKTSTPSQIVKILKAGGLNKEDVTVYCKSVMDNFEVFTNRSTNFTREDMKYMLKYIATDFPHEHVVFDIDNGDKEFNKVIIEHCDIVVLNVTQSIEEAHSFRDNREEYMKVIGNKPLIVVINKYNSAKSTIKELANWMGIKKPNNWLVVHENPWITWATNHGNLPSLFKNIIKKDVRVLELSGELTKIVDTLHRAKQSSSKK